MNLLRCYRGSIDGKSTSMDREAVENLSAIQKVFRWIEKLLRHHQDEFQKAQWIEIVLTSVEKRRKRGTIDANLLRIYRKAVELEEKEFFKERKNT